MYIVDFDPVALKIPLPWFDVFLPIRWYGICYLLGFLVSYKILQYRIKNYPWIAKIWRGEFSDFFVNMVLGVVIGGRLGEILFYHPQYYLTNPIEILKVWEGGMSFHGGFLGVLCAMWLWSRKQQIKFIDLAEFVAPTVPFGLALGRIGNFINGELWGRVSNHDLPWAMIFPRAGDVLPRHPSQLYQMLGEGFILFFILLLLSKKELPRYRIGGLFLIGYGIARFIAEFFREPDSGIFGLSYTVSMGQWLSLPMILIGLYLLFLSFQSQAKALNSNSINTNNSPNKNLLPNKKINNKKIKNS